MIPVTKPFLPDREKFDRYIDGVFERNWLTNHGPLVKKFENELRGYLGVSDLLFVTNGTIALQIAIKALNLRGEVITTPFSYVATTSSLVWEGCEPVYVDINEMTFNIDASKIERAITPKTTAIVATHCFGNACDIDQIEEIASKHDLSVIYDAAHCFGTKYKGRSIFTYGDISVGSLHATKVMHSVEGGLIVSNNKETLQRASYMMNFGHDGFDRFNGVGVNGKNSEFHAAMGLSVLDDIDVILAKRREQCALYDSLLKEDFKSQGVQDLCSFNYAYYPIVFESEDILLRVKEALELKQIFCRRYFYPSLNRLEYVGDFEVPISERISKTILCLPLYHTLSLSEQNQISEIIIKTTFRQ